MENTPCDQEEPSNTEATSPTQAPSSLKPLSETWQQHNPESMFLMGVGIGLLSILFAQVLTLPTTGGIPGCVLPALGLLFAPLVMVSKPQRILAVGLLLGFLIATAVSFALWLQFICPPGTGC